MVAALLPEHYLERRHQATIGSAKHRIDSLNTFQSQFHLTNCTDGEISTGECCRTLKSGRH